MVGAFRTKRTTAALGSRFVSTFLRCALVAILIFSQPPSTQANLMGVDLGLAYIKVSVARPGRGLELVTNEQAKRKTPAAVGFTEDGERLFGDAAIAYSGKAPARVILDGRAHVGRCAANETSSDASRFCSRAVLDVPGAGKFNGEEIIAMLLGMARSQASAALDGAAVKDVVITVPAWFDERDRIAVADSAKIVGLNCLGVVNANTAAAIKYAIDGKASNHDSDIADSQAGDSNGKSTKPALKKSVSSKYRTQTVMFFDFGAGSATATIARIAVDAKTGAATAVKVLGHAWERDVGGRALDDVIIDRLASDFDEQRGSQATPSRQLPRVMMRLRKEAQRVREILSANTETQVAVPSLYDDTDLRTIIKRDLFESGASGILARSVRPARAVLKRSGLSIDDIDAVVPFGGASRTPKFQELLCSALGRPALNKSINSDEAAVMGSAFLAASLSSTFRVRKVDIEDSFPRGVSAEVDRDRKSSGGLFSSAKAANNAQKVVVFPDGTAKMPAKKTLNFKRSDDFSVAIYLDKDTTGSSRFPERTLYTKFKVSGVAKVLKKLKDGSKAKSLVPQIALTILVDRSGFIRIGNAESSLDEKVIVEREIDIEDDADGPKLKKGGELDAKTLKSASKDTKGEEDHSDGNQKDQSFVKGGKTDIDQEAQSDASDESKTDEGKEEKEQKNDKKGKSQKRKKQTRIEKSTQTIVHRQSLTVTVQDDPTALVNVRMSKKDVDSSKQVLRDLEQVDRDRHERAESLNALEGFVLEIRSSMKSINEDDAIYMVSTEDERAKFIRELDDAENWMYSDEAQQTANLRMKLHELRRTHTAMDDRSKELVERPSSVRSLRTILDKSSTDLADIRALHVERGSQHVYAFKLHDKLVENVTAWLENKELSQSQLKMTDTPAFTSRDVYKKGDEVRRSMLTLLRLELPPAPTQSVAPDEKDSKLAGGSDSSPNSSMEGNDAELDVTADQIFEPETGRTEKAGSDVDVDISSGSASDNHDEL